MNKDYVNSDFANIMGQSRPKSHFWSTGPNTDLISDTTKISFYQPYYKAWDPFFSSSKSFERYISRQQPEFCYFTNLDLRLASATQTLLLNFV